MNVRVKAYAKLNLTLSITGVYGGFHMLDSLVCSVDLFDLITLKKRKDGLISVEMHGRGCESMPFESNNAVKAAEKYVEKFKTGGAHIVVYKNIPLGAGLGGSSADAAGVLKGMAKLYGRGSEAEIKELADELGSDAGYMLNGGFAVLKGRGEKVEPIDGKHKLNFLLLVPQSGVATAQCYSLYDKLPHTDLATDNAVQALKNCDTAELAKSMNNALYSPAVRLNSDVEKAFCELESFAPLGVNMTGSGSGVFAVFDSAELCAWARSRYRGKFECIQLKSVIPKK